MRKLVEANRDKLGDVLIERAAAERVGARLYARVVERVARAEPAVRRMLPQLERQRDEEQEHGRWLAGELRALDRSAFSPNARAQRVNVELRGIEELILDGHATLPELFHALLGAELLDAAGWGFLVQLAARAGDESARRQFAERRLRKEEHVAFLRRAVEEFTHNDVLGVPVTMPIAP
jgi:hypothetical protein